jgi:serine/threonine protein kinase
VGVEAVGERGLDRFEQFLVRYGRVFTMDEEEIARGRALFDRYGAGIVGVGRIIPTIRSLISVPAGLVHMHKQGVIHADMKPNNIMLGRGTNAKILDYGLAWVKGEPKDRVQGTLEYMAPETAQHKLINERTDIFNFGATMYRLVTQQLPPRVVSDLPGVDKTEKTYRSLVKPVKELYPGCPEEFANLIHKCMSYNAMKRPERMSEVQGLLDQMADEAAAKLPDPSSIED